jgi:hypothetical protein
MLTLLIVLGIVALVGLASWKAGTPRDGRGCCSSGPWPPTDLIPEEDQPVARRT